MKKKLLSCALFLMLAVALGNFAFAADAPKDSGIYNVKVKSDYASTVDFEVQIAKKPAEKSEAKINGTDVVYYEKADNIKFKVSGLADNSYYLILAQTDEELPTVSNIAYIDQETASSSSVEFTVYPSTPKTSTTYYVYLAGGVDGKVLIATFDYNYVTKLAPGDCDGNAGVTANDATVVLQYTVGKHTFDDDQSVAADCDGYPGITANDATVILQICVSS